MFIIRSIIEKLSFNTFDAIIVVVDVGLEFHGKKEHKLTVSIVSTSTAIFRKIFF